MVELANATDRPPAAGPPLPATTTLRLTVSPKRQPAKRLTAWGLRVTAGGRPMPGATVRLGGKRAITNADGTAKIAVRFFHPGVKRASASHPGYRRVVKTIRVR
jgi:hypothetical protein